MELLRFWVVLLLPCVALMGCDCSGISSGRFDKMNIKPSIGVFDVAAYGAVGDGKTDDSKAFLKAWTDMCGSRVSLSPTLYIAPGKTFLLKPVTFQGPCRSPKPQIRVLGNIVAPDTISAWYGYDPNTWLQFSNVNGLNMKGPGKIDGRGSVWWSQNSQPCSDQNDYSDVGNGARPTALTFTSCNGLQLRGLTHLNSQRNHISITGCHNVRLSNLNISAPGASPNTDGINIAGSSSIEINDSFIGTGDDCIAVNGGCSFINITNVACGPGHGISIGSLGEHQRHEIVEEIHVKSCNFTKTLNGVRIKTWQGGSGYARSISFGDIKLVKVWNPIIIDQFYCPSHQGCMNYTSAVKISDVTFNKVSGTSTGYDAINLSCSQTLGCSNIILKEINITAAPGSKGNKTTAFCFNAHGKAEATSPTVSCLSS